MKLTRREIVWLVAVAALYALYNLPFIPGYGNRAGTLIHSALTLIPLWATVYFGMFRIFREHPLKDKEDK